MTVLTPDGEVRHPWATSAVVSKRGVLKIYNGLAVRAFYPHGDWTQYTVTAPLIPAREPSARIVSAS